jgi:hypothetical protein
VKKLAVSISPASGGGQMLKQFVITVLLLLSLIALVANSVEAQSAYRLKVDVPFQFVLHGQTLPAGKYVIERTNPAKPNILTLKKVDRGPVRLVITQRVENDEPSTASSLIFIQRNGKHYLFQVWTVTAMNGNQIPNALDKKVDEQQSDKVTFVTLRAKQSVSHR